MNVCAEAPPNSRAVEAAKAAHRMSLMLLECVFVQVCGCATGRRDVVVDGSSGRRCPVNDGLSFPSRVVEYIQRQSTILKQSNVCRG